MIKIGLIYDNTLMSIRAYSKGLIAMDLERYHAETKSVKTLIPTAALPRIMVKITLK